MKSPLMLAIVIIISSCSLIEDKGMKQRKIRTPENKSKSDITNLEFSLLETKNNTSKKNKKKNNSVIIVDDKKNDREGNHINKPKKVIFRLHTLLSSGLNRQSPNLTEKGETLLNKKIEGVAMLPMEFANDNNSLYQICEKQFDIMILNHMRDVLDTNHSPGKYILKSNSQCLAYNFVVYRYSLDYSSNSCCSFYPTYASLALKAAHGIIYNQGNCHCLIQENKTYSKNECISCNFAEVALLSFQGQANWLGSVTDLPLCINEKKGTDQLNNIDEEEYSDFITLEIIKIIIPKKGHSGKFDYEYELQAQSLDELYGHSTAIYQSDTMIQSGKERVYYKIINEFCWAGPLGNIPCNAYPAFNECRMLGGCRLFDTKAWVDYFLQNKILMLSKRSTIVDYDSSNFIYDENNQVIAQKKIIYRLLVDGNVIISAPQPSNKDILKDFFNPNK